MQEIKLGTIGSGVIVDSVLSAVESTPGIRLEAVYSRTAERAQTLAEKFRAGKTYTDKGAFFADGEVNCVYVATPNLLHDDSVRQALEAGKNVICEKPFSTRADQAEKLFALAEEKGLFLVEAAPTTYLPNYAVLRSLLPELGRIRLVMANYSQYSSRYDSLLAGELTNIFNPALGGGCLMDINFYNVYLTVALFGQPQTARYAPNLFHLPKGGSIDTSGVVTMGYPDFTCTLAGAKDTWGVNYYQIEGEQGYLYVRDGSNGLAALELVTKNRRETFNLQSDPSRWYYEIQTLTPLLLAEDREVLTSRRDITLTTVRVIESMRREAGILFPGDR